MRKQVTLDFINWTKTMLISMYVRFLQLVMRGKFALKKFQKCVQQTNWKFHQ